MYQIKKGIAISNLTITSGVAPALFERVNAFIVRVQCNPAFNGTDKNLMQKVCEILTNATDRKLALRTQNVVYEASFVNNRIEELTFQVLTPNEPLW